MRRPRGHATLWATCARTLCGLRIPDYAWEVSDMALFSPPDIDKLKAKHDIDGLIKALAHKDRRVVLDAVKALGAVPDIKATGPLINALRNDYWAIRVSAAESLGRIRSERAIEPLVTLLRDEHWRVRQAAAQALGNIKWEPRTPQEEALYSG